MFCLINQDSNDVDKDELDWKLPHRPIYPGALAFWQTVDQWITSLFVDVFVCFHG